MGFQLLWRPLTALFFLRRQIRPDVGARNDQSMHQIRMIPHQDQGEIGTVTVSHDVDAAEPLDDCSGVIGHQFKGERPGAVRAMTMPARIDADYRAIGREIIPLPGEIVVKEDHPAVQKYDGRAVAIDLGVELGAPDLVVALRATGAIRVRSCGGEPGDGGENGTCETVHDASLSVDVHVPADAPLDAGEG